LNDSGRGFIYFNKRREYKGQIALKLNYPILGNIQHNTTDNRNINCPREMIELNVFFADIKAQLSCPLNIQMNRQ